MRVARVCIPEPGALVVEEVDLPPLDPDAVTVLHAGMCGSDLHAYHRGQPWLGYPIRSDLEVPDVIVALGSGVTGVRTGEAVIVNPVISSRTSRTYRHCSRGRANLCDQLVSLGSHFAGAMAEAFNLPASALTAVAPGVSPLAA